MYGFPYIEGQGLKCAFHHAFSEITTPQTIRREVGEDEKAQIREHPLSDENILKPVKASRYG